MSLGTPNRTMREVLAGNIDYDTDTLRVALYDDSTAYSFDPDTDEFVADILDGGTTAQELQASSGYTGPADRETITNTTITQDNTTDEGVFDGDDVTWQNVESTENIQGWIIYKQVGGDDSTPNDDPVLLIVDDDMTAAPKNLPLTTNGSDITIQWSVDGIKRLGVA